MSVYFKNIMTPYPLDFNSYGFTVLKPDIDPIIAILQYGLPKTLLIIKPPPVDFDFTRELNSVALRQIDILHAANSSVGPVIVIGCRSHVYDVMLEKWQVLGHRVWSNFDVPRSNTLQSRFLSSFLATIPDHAGSMG
jgi:hypothetical protein